MNSTNDFISGAFSQLLIKTFVFLFLDCILGLAVHQIITITVSLIMVIAALITTLVLKNW